MAVNFPWHILIGIVNFFLRIKQLMIAKEGEKSERRYREDIENIKKDPAGAFDSMFGGGMRDDQPGTEERTDASEASKARADESSKP